MSALISTAPQLADNDEVREIEIDLIRPGQQQPRTTFDQVKLEELAQSIRTTGVIQPLLVRPLGGMFELVAGERRWRAAQIAGLTRVPSIVRVIPDEKVLELALIENIQRAELNAVEEARAYKGLIESLALTQDEVAQRVGRDRTFVTNYLRVLKLPKDIQDLIETEKISFGHARALLSIQDPIIQRRLAQKIVNHSWSVRETERRVKQFSQPQAKRPIQAPSVTPDPNVRAAETKLRRILATQVRILPGSPGKIEIEYYDLADLDRIFSLITKNAAQDNLAQSAM